MNFSIYLTTLEFAQLRKCPKANILAQVQRTGQCDGVTPHRLPNGSYSWEAKEVYQALRMIPPRGDSPADDFRNLLCDRTGADPYQAHLITSELLRHSVGGADKDQDTREAVEDLDAFLLLHSALQARVGNTLAFHEELFSNHDWLKFELIASRVERDSGNLVQALRVNADRTVAV